jgi:DNA topoisomerase VI subunit B
MMKPAAGYRPLAYSSPEAVQTTGTVAITDNGRGIPAETVETMLDNTVRVSSREAYVSSTRGAQGNALKCIVAMGFALDGVNSMTVIESLDRAHRIVFEIDPVRREPRIAADSRLSR